MGRSRHLLVAAGISAALLSTGAALTYYEGALPTTLNPLYAAKMVDYRAQELVFDRLWYHSPINNELESRLGADRGRQGHQARARQRHQVA
jgi:hypothetical protein